MAEQFPTVRYLSFSRNFGHQFALKAGLDYADGDCVISMDGDMQHPPELIPAMLEGWEQGNDVVYTIREEDKQLPYGKRQSSKLFYNLLNNLSDIELEEGSADFRLLSSQVVSIIRNLKEYDIFFRGMVKWMGFSQMAIRYQPAERKHGASKYTFKKMVRLALQGITSFSTKPLYIATYLGFFFSRPLYSYYPTYCIVFTLGIPIVVGLA
jgi:dolichol-phosphate mannosyltransferase